MQSSMFDPDGYLYPKYAIAKTTWAYCWRCGEKIAINHTDEITIGVHSGCRTMRDVNTPVTNEIRIYLVD